MAPPLSSLIHDLKVGDSIYVKTKEEKKRIYGAAARYRPRYGQPVGLHSSFVEGSWRITRIS